MKSAIKTVYYIYMISEEDGSPVYIGTTTRKNLKNRIYTHKRRGILSDSRKLDIIYCSLYESCIDEMEEVFITEYDTYRNGENKTPDGKGVFYVNGGNYAQRGNKYSESSRKKMSETRKRLIKEGKVKPPRVTKEGSIKARDAREALRRENPLSMKSEESIKKAKECVIEYLKRPKLEEDYPYDGSFGDRLWFKTKLSAFSYVHANRLGVSVDTIRSIINERYITSEETRPYAKISFPEACYLRELFPDWTPPDYIVINPIGRLFANYDRAFSRYMADINGMTAAGVYNIIKFETNFSKAILRDILKDAKILGSSGYQNFEKVIKTNHERYVKITFDDGSDIKCSLNHRFIIGKSSEDWILAEDVETGMNLSGKTVFDSEIIDENIDLYDVVNADDHTYYTNGVLSHNCMFLSDRGTLIDSRILEKMESEEPTFYPSDSLYMWKKDLKGKNVAISIDVSEGIGKDYHAMHISDVDEFEQIGEYKNNTLTQTEYVKEIIRVIDLCYKLGAEEVYYTVENNSIGSGVIMLLQNTDSDSLDKATFISHGDYQNKLGMPTNTKTKPHGCQKLKDLVELGKYKIRSEYLINELKFFVKTKGSFAAESGKHDDLCMAAVLMMLLLEQLSDYEESAYDRMAEVAYDDAEDAFEVGIF